MSCCAKLVDLFEITETGVPGKTLEAQEVDAKPDSQQNIKGLTHYPKLVIADEGPSFVTSNSILSILPFFITIRLLSDFCVKNDHSLV